MFTYYILMFFSTRGFGSLTIAYKCGYIMTGFILRSAPE
jgi:hypothetical protein